MKGLSQSLQFFEQPVESVSLQDRALGIDVVDKKEWADVTESSTHKFQVTLSDLCTQLKGKSDKSLVKLVKVNIESKTEDFYLRTENIPKWIYWTFQTNESIFRESYFLFHFNSGSVCAL